LYVAVLALVGCTEPNPAYPGSAPDLDLAGDGSVARASRPDGSMMVIKADSSADSSGAKGSSAIQISEIMANPDCVDDRDGEWIELFNPASHAVNINGWILRDDDDDFHVISADGPLIVPPKGYIVLGRSDDEHDNGGLEVAYAYSDIVLSNHTDEIVLINQSGKVVDSVSYSHGAGFTIPEGASLSFKQQGGAKNNPASWCVEPSPWPGSDGDTGTPGSKPGC
jgi:hypothetical protein